MKTLSIDVGIKNLAFCLFNERKVEKWDVIDLSKKDEYEVPLCTSTMTKKGVATPCNKKAIFQKDNQCFCKVHAKQQKDVLVCPKNLRESSMKSAKVDEVKALATEYKLSFKPGSKKETIIKLLNDFREKNCFSPVKVEKKVNCSKIDLVTIGKAIKTKFDIVFPANEKVDCILIENQIGPMAIRMKAIQGMLAQYFIMRETCENIEFVNAGNKLKKFEKDDQSTYKNRKQLGIVKCIEELNKVEENKTYIPILENHKKKDDLADCFLQGIWYLDK